MAYPFGLKMKYLRLKTTNPYYNLALEEYLLYNSNEDIFMIWQNAPTVVIGKNQNAYAEVYVDRAKEKNVFISRRITGGGAVYHDLGNVNYTFITSDTKAKALDYEYFTRPIILALNKLGLSCELSGRNDLLCEGKKFSGNAQYASNGRILHHGTLLFDTSFDDMSDVLRVDKEKLECNSVKSHKSRVVNLKSLLEKDISLGEFIGAIEEYVLNDMGAEAAQIDENETILKLFERNQSDEWIFSSKRYLTNYKLSRRKKFPFGVVNAEIKLHRDIIEDIVISGDFFGVADISELECSLIGKSIDRIEKTDISRYIDKMSDTEFISFIRNGQL